MSDKRVLVIGAGIVGTTAINVLKSEGFDPVCYERSDNYGGTWYYHKEAVFGQASIMPTTNINHSKEMGAFSNFPPRKEFSNFMRHSQLLEYIREYARHHDSERHIKCNVEVLNVTQADDYDKTGRWTVTSKDLLSGEVSAETFDGVLVATGHINMPFMPDYPGQDSFSGNIIHSHGLKEVEGFTGKRVVVVGTGCSALDAAVALSRVAKQVYLSTRSGAHVWHRLSRGYPIDYVLLRRYLTFLLTYVPNDLASWYVETFYLDRSFDHRLYAVKPKYHALNREPIVNDHIGYKLLTGTVVQKRDISKFYESGVFFEGEETPTEIDAVVMATGYTWKFPVLEDGVVTTDGNIFNLYKLIYPVHLPHPTLAILGFFNPYGPGYPIDEMQCRYAAYLLSGRGKLPSRKVMMQDIDRRNKENSNRYIPGEKRFIRVHYVQYMDEIAQEMGVKPNLLKYMVTDFALFLRLIFGPSLSYQYRLEGHGKWEGARDAIMSVEERVQWPLRKRKPVNKGIIVYILDYIYNLLPVSVYVWK